MKHFFIYLTCIKMEIKLNLDIVKPPNRVLK